MISATQGLQILVAGALALVSAAILFRPRPFRRWTERLPTSLAFRIPVGVIALVAAIAMAVAIPVPFLAFFASALAAVFATAFGLFSALRGAAGVGTLFLAILGATVAIAVGQPLGLKVLVLPKADSLPYAPVAATVVKTYGEGVWFESVRAGPDGTLYLAANLGLNFSASPYYRRAQGQVIARRPDGAERSIFRTPLGSTAGVFAIAADGTLYMTSNGDAPGVWRISPEGQGRVLAKLPRGAWPNGLDFGPDGNLYAPDSALGLVWRIDPTTGQAERAIEDKRLSARPFIALAPGANGLHFRGQDMIVTVSDSTLVLSYKLGANGRFSGPAVLARGIPGDDFAVGRDGSLFITTHPYNTVVRLAPDGVRTVIADARQHIVGATDAVFGRTENDQDTLYVATDGGAFTGGPRTRGQLVALKPYGPAR